MDLKTLEIMLDEVAESVKNASANYFSEAEKVVIAKFALESAEDVAWLSGSIDGKNEALRLAQLRQACKQQYDDLRNAERKERTAKFILDQFLKRSVLAHDYLRILEISAKG